MREPEAQPAVARRPRGVHTGRSVPHALTPQLIVEVIRDVAFHYFPRLAPGSGDAALGQQLLGVAAHAGICAGTLISRQDDNDCRHPSFSMSWDTASIRAR